MKSPECCPLHGDGRAEIDGGWSCPDDCEHFAAELARRCEQVSVMGNFTRTWIDSDGHFWKQHYRHFLPISDPEPWGRRRSEP